MGTAQLIHNLRHIEEGMVLQQFPVWRESSHPVLTPHTPQMESPPQGNLLCSVEDVATPWSQGHPPLKSDMPALLGAPQPPEVLVEAVPKLLGIGSLPLVVTLKGKLPPQHINQVLREQACGRIGASGGRRGSAGLSPGIPRTKPKCPPTPPTPHATAQPDLLEACYSCSAQP